MPSDLTLMFKAMITMEGLGRQYDPEFRVVDHLQPLLRRVLSERYRRERTARLSGSRSPAPPGRP
jgi:ubiquinone biosynthesis protein